MKVFLSFIFSILFLSITAQVQGKLLGTWSDSSLVASNAHFNTYNEIWGLAVNDMEFAVLGTTLGTHIIDVTDPQTPEELFVIEGGSIGAGIIHRDFHDYKGYLYSIADEGNNTGLQIIDISNLPNSIDVAYDSREFFSRSHNIFIDSTRARLYSFISNGTDIPFAPMRIFDISNPIDPIMIGTYSDFDGYQISQVHDGFVRNDSAYLNLGPRGFALVEFADVDTPNVISVLTPAEYPDSDYNHSGWPTDDGKYYYMADERIDRDIKVLDMTDLPDIEIPTLFNAGGDGTQSIPHNQIVHGDKLYVSYYFDGLQVYDISDPVNPVREMFYPTSTEVAAPNLYRGAWGVYPFLPSGNILVSDMQEGLFVVDGKLPTNTQDIEERSLFSISPNPSSGIVDILYQGETTYATLLSIDGQVLKQTKISKGKTSIDFSEFKNGIYLIQTKSNDRVVTEKIIKI